MCYTMCIHMGVVYIYIYIWVFILIRNLCVSIDVSYTV